MARPGGQTERWGHHPRKLGAHPPEGQGDDRGMSQPRTIPQVLDRIADRFSERNARVTFADLRAEVRRAAAAMIDLGVGAGDRVAIWSPNTWHWVVACLATHYAGGVLVPLNTRYTASEATDILARTGAP